MSKPLLIASVASCILTGAAIAHPAHETPPAKQVKRIVIYNRDGTQNEIDVDRIAGEATKCASRAEPFDSTAESGAGGRKARTRMVLCGDKDAKVLAALESARDRLARESERNEAHRARAIESLDREIARLKQGEAAR